MTTLHLTRTTAATAQEFLAALTHFARGRSELFPNSMEEFLTVHAWGDDFADVTEGGRGTWERLYYDWSDPTRVVLQTTASNVWGGSSGHTYSFIRKPDGTTDVELVTVREGKNLKGRLLGLVLGTFGKRVLVDAFETGIKAIEARNAASTAIESPKEGVAA